MKINIWLKAFRLRTLPLALSCSILGSFLAYADGKYRWMIFLFSSLTILFLQILSNLANDYGDTIHGVDNEKRVGPERVTQTGLVSKKQMRRMICVFIILSFLSGSILIFIGLHNIFHIVLFFVLGLAAICAAIKYTIGKNPFGYVGLGDLFVFLFFGIAGVAGTYYLHTQTMNFWIFLPASAIGMLSSGVLNLNNLRDIENDARTGKKTLVVRLGTKAAKYYHVSLLSLSLLMSLIYTFKYYHSVYQFLYVLTFPLFVYNIHVVLQNAEPIKLNGELKKLAFSTFAFSVTFGIGLIL
ncbi:MAG: 1,4-dihydroxy-2-naphthoate polyprenyltransferase [Bacteroidales bacterium]|nr:1,4-dihydroxy-2-naphthoate polyprenyltransferase [Bacteroidales bacterium]